MPRRSRIPACRASRRPGHVLDGFQDDERANVHERGILAPSLVIALHPVERLTIPASEQEALQLPPDFFHGTPGPGRSPRAGYSVSPPPVAAAPRVSASSASAMACSTAPAKAQGIVRARLLLLLLPVLALLPDVAAQRLRGRGGIPKNSCRSPGVGTGAKSGRIQPVQRGRGRHIRSPPCRPGTWRPWPAAVGTCPPRAAPRSG